MNHCSYTGKASMVADHQENRHKVVEYCHDDISTTFLILANFDEFVLPEKSDSEFQHP